MSHGQRSGPRGDAGRVESSAAPKPLDFVAQRTPIEVVERSCDATFLHLVSAGVVGTHPEDLVVATLRRIMAEARELHEDESPARAAAPPAPVQRRPPAGTARTGESCRGSRQARRLAATSALLVFVGAVVMLDVEREAEGANITTPADAFWWACTTITTVGYGDRYPVTNVGRVIAVLLMIVGIALLGVLTASIAAWFVRAGHGGGRGRRSAPAGPGAGARGEGRRVARTAPEVTDLPPYVEAPEHMAVRALVRGQLVDLDGWAAGGASLAGAREQVRDGLRFFVGEDVEILEGDLERPVVVRHVVVTGAGQLSDASGTTAAAAVTRQPTPVAWRSTHSPSQHVRATA